MPHEVTGSLRIAAPGGSIDQAPSRISRPVTAIRVSRKHAELDVVGMDPARDADFAAEVGLVAYNCVVASRLGHLAAMYGCRPGRDVGIAACEDSHELGRTWPELTRVQCDRFAMGVTAAEMALALIADPDTACPSRMVAGGLIAGQTA